MCPSRRPERSDRETGLGAIIDQLTAGRPWAAGMRLGELGRRWADVVGERLARESEPAGLEGGMLVVRVSSAAWGAQVRFLGGQIAARANETLGREVVRGVRVFVDTPRPSG